ncbi:fluoride efflux transporter FluC [Companilactobacillus keshanensis]|uniref:Fluoride-specific ion channel FluC n=1 Tax=Companilactobacillus keshanensis TaxID=2486003 RepID=A0ABW4BTJ2_9LACO|nr:CrcB family protein [Companilactobacillus keshanensis]
MQVWFFYKEVRIIKEFKTFTIIFIGAFIGSNLRYGESLLFTTSDNFPWGTVVANLSGAFILPFLIHYLQDRYKLSSKTILSLSTGLLGSYTTFSTFTADAYRLFETGNWIYLAGYLFLTMIGGFLFAIVGNYWAVSRAFRDLERSRK